ncbi:lysozyme [Paenibacillus pabuli]|uniref:lysozyme n=1 Tax=Paenibacillus pabuli TaxID=1472 RepID=UPI0034580528
MRKTSTAGIALIKSFEGCRLTAYKPVQTEVHWTIGWGHYGPGVLEGQKITQPQADAMLVEDLSKYEAYVNSHAYVPMIDQLTQYQFDALVSFTYNCGAGNLKTLCKDRTVVQIGESIAKYNKSSGTVLSGLVRRRQAEIDLFNTPDDFLEEDKEAVNQVKDINVPSKWAEAAWKEVTSKGYFDGTRPGAMITREELGVVVSRLLKYMDQKG